MDHHLHHMDHAGMGDGGMDHGGHGGGGMDHGDGGMDMGGKCSMHMLWNTQTIDTCIVFPQWHIRTHTQFALSLLAVAALGVLYEYLRAFARQADRRIARALVVGDAGAGKGKGRVSDLSTLGRRSPSPGAREDDALLTGRRAFKGSPYPVPAHLRALRAAVYAAQVFLSFFLMLIFMTYNAYLILAVVAGAAIGHYVLGGYLDADGILGGANADTKGMACH